MKARDYFPLGIASGLGFCNRLKETQLLVENIKNTKHTLLMATRRYGKSSLALHAINQSKLPFVETDFYMASNEKIVETYILNSIVELIGKALGPVDKWITTIKQYVKNLKPKIDIGTSVIKLELTSVDETDSATAVKEGLLLLEKLLAEKQQKAILFFDEFQMVGVIAQGKGIEAAIRHVAQKTRYLTFIFSGSNRKLLKTMFEDESRPLYKLCGKIGLKRISITDYATQIKKAAKLAWDQALNDSAFDQIILLTERHPYYLNKLCDQLLAQNIQRPPGAKEIKEIWRNILEEEKSDAVKELSLLSLGQKRVLMQIAQDPRSQLTSKEIILTLRMSSSSIITALEGLEEKDVIEKEEDRYIIINPIIKFYVLKGRP